jgi:hypothetical protein
MALLTLALRPDVRPLPGHIRDKHYARKHGPAATYGQATRGQAKTGLAGRP